MQGGGRRRSGGYGDRRQRGNKNFSRKIVREINLSVHYPKLLKILLILLFHLSSQKSACRSDEHLL